MINAETIRKGENVSHVKVAVSGNGAEVVDEWIAVCKGCLGVLSESGDFSDDELVDIVRMVIMQSVTETGETNETKQTDLS